MHREPLAVTERHEHSHPLDDRLITIASVADTAFSIAAVRAEEGARPEGERLFDDPHAALFAAAGMHAAEATQRYLDLPFFRDGIRLRTRFIDDVVREAIGDGIDQVVILGAGFDARAWRLPEIAARHATVFEIDLPEQVARKQAILADANIALPAHVVFVPFAFTDDDLERSLTAALVERGFRVGAGAVFVWEGVIGYIDRGAIDRSLRFMASAGGRGSRLAFTYGPGAFDPDSATDAVRRAGFASCEEFTGEDLWRRHWRTEPHPHAFAMMVAKATC